MDPDKVVLLPDVVPKQEVSFPLESRQEDVRIAVIVKIGEDRSAPIGNGIDSRDAGDV